MVRGEDALAVLTGPELDGFEFLCAPAFANN